MSTAQLMIRVRDKATREVARFRDSMALSKPLKGADTLVAIRERRADFNEIRERVRAAGTDSRAHFGEDYHIEGGLSLQQNTEEFTALVLFLREHGPFHRYMEIGSASGGACLFLHREVGLGRVLSLDDKCHPRASEQPGNFSRLPEFRQFVGDSHSHDALDFLTANANARNIDLAFIDGENSYKGVKSDIGLTIHFCKPRALVIFHDTVACPGVRAAWSEAISDGRLKLLAHYVGKDQPMGISVNEKL